MRVILIPVNICVGYMYLSQENFIGAPMSSFWPGEPGMWDCKAEESRVLRSFETSDASHSLINSWQNNFLNG